MNRTIGLAGMAIAALAAGGSGAAALPAVPAPVQCYVDRVNARDLDGLAACFAEDAVVIDVSRRIEGRPAIHAWAEREVIGGRVRVVSAAAEADGRVRTRVHWAPSGSDGWDAWYVFRVDDRGLVEADLQYVRPEAGASVDAERIAADFLRLINAGDGDAVAALFAGDAVFDSVGRIYDGRAAIMGRFLGPEVIAIGGQYEQVSSRVEPDGRLLVEYRFTTPSGLREHFTYAYLVSDGLIRDVIGRYMR